MAHASYMVLFVLAAAGQLSFASDNRSTRLRIVMLIQQVLITGWMLYVWRQVEEDEVLFIPLILSAIHWAIMGAFMTGEWPELSPRVKRSLPQSFLGRAFLTWFNPGSGTGYVFACVNLFATCIVISLIATASWMFGISGSPDLYEILVCCALLCGYLAAYLGAGRLIILVLRRYLYFGLLLPFLVHIILVVLGAALPTFLQAWMLGFSNFDDYSELQAPNWWWTIYEAIDGDMGAYPVVPVLVVGAGLMMFLVNMVLAAREVEQVRQETPDRVMKDEIELHPEKAEVPKVSSSPFDD
jgi:hypothetical protein